MASEAARTIDYEVRDANGELPAELSSEERETLLGWIREIGAIAIEDAVSRTPRKELDEAGRTRRIGANVGKQCRQLVFWEGKGDNPDGWIHKTAREVEAETGMTRGQQRTARRVGVEEGLFEIEPGFRPSDRRPTNYYRLNVLNVATTIITSEAEKIARRLDRERRKDKRDALASERRKLEERRQLISSITERKTINPKPELEHGQLNQNTWLTLQGNVANFAGLQKSPQRVPQKNTNSVRYSVGVEATNTEGSEKPGGSPATPSATTTPGNSTGSAQKTQRGGEAATGIVKTDSALQRMQKLGRVFSGERFVSFLFASVKGTLRDELAELAPQHGRNWKRMVRKYTPTVEEAAKIAERTARDLYSPQEAIRDLVKEGKLGTEKFGQDDDSRAVTASPAPEGSAEGSTPNELPEDDQRALEHVLRDPESRASRLLDDFRRGNGLVLSVRQVAEAANDEAFPGSLRDELSVGQYVQAWAEREAVAV